MAVSEVSTRGREAALTCTPMQKTKHTNLKMEKGKVQSLGCSSLSGGGGVLGPCSCHLLAAPDLSFWLYLRMRGERECSFTKSSGNLYWGNMVSRKPSRKT